MLAEMGGRMLGAISPALHGWPCLLWVTLFNLVPQSLPGFHAAEQVVQVAKAGPFEDTDTDTRPMTDATGHDEGPVGIETEFVQR